MRRLSKLWTAVGSAVPVIIGSALGGLGLVDFNTLLAISLIPQLVFLAIGQWPDFQRTTHEPAWEEHEFECLPRYVVRPVVVRQRLMSGRAMNETMAGFEMSDAHLGRAR
ncbi:hypothetical protein SOM59_19975 [Pseudomonas coleopterorum]|uniref:hypothetical protein n=1 Tax=Pseudomonas coleopterorum TaxID=1605838 RepID=UPI000F0711B8|nr:hypothetical protein [Pseudomonas coleopterorum]MBD8482530.1 hypothetical protein [Pseudomonas coleopterorum]MDY1019363.1 hypothetical protein [Pseudomonas coleopterorum]